MLILNWRRNINSILGLNFSEDLLKGINIYLIEKINLVELNIRVLSKML